MSRKRTLDLTSKKISVFLRRNGMRDDTVIELPRICISTIYKKLKPYLNTQDDADNVFVIDCIEEFLEQWNQYYSSKLHMDFEGYIHRNVKNGLLGPDKLFFLLKDETELIQRVK
ncbi:hypothetical protein [Paenibacillus sp. HGF7]|uniref:hypothetical protein n=2 Tax=unclassified Paenibacillus TaxID=185978 RepID=UPI00055B1D0B|nr:hypothetical protein [Paenibacillus sp. HGF7]